MRSDSDMTLGDFDIDSALQQMDHQVFQGAQGAEGVGMDVDLMDLGMLLDDKRCEAAPARGGDGCLEFLPERGPATSAAGGPSTATPCEAGSSQLTAAPAKPTVKQESSVE